MFYTPLSCRQLPTPSTLTKHDSPLNGCETDNTGPVIQCRASLSNPEGLQAGRIPQNISLSSTILQTCSRDMIGMSIYKRWFCDILTECKTIIVSIKRARSEE